MNYNTNAILIKYKGYEFMAIKELYDSRIATDEIYSLYGRHNGYSDWLKIYSHGIGNQTLEEFLNSCYLDNAILQLKIQYKED